MSNIDQKCGETGTLGNTLRGDGSCPHPSSKQIRGCFSDHTHGCPWAQQPCSDRHPRRNAGWWCVYSATGQEAARVSTPELGEYSVW